MDIRTLSYFAAVAEELNITKAAEKLKMSQPPLSSQIKALEQELNTQLFIRGKRHLRLTESGQLLYRRAKEILNLTDKAASEIISMSRGMTGTVSIGLVEGAAPDIAAGWIAGFMKLYPGVHFRLLDGNSDELVEKLRSGIISLAVITSPCDNLLLNSFPVGREKLAVFMNRDHPLARREGNSITISDLKGERLIVPGRRALIETLYKWFKAVKAEPGIICEMDSYLDAAALAARGAGISIFPRTAFIPNASVAVKELEGSERSVEYLFSWRKGHPLPAVEEAFIDYVKGTAGLESGRRT